MSDDPAATWPLLHDETQPTHPSVPTSLRHSATNVSQPVPSHNVAHGALHNMAAGFSHHTVGVSTGHATPPVHLDESHNGKSLKLSGSTESLYYELPDESTTWLLRDTDRFTTDQQATPVRSNAATYQQTAPVSLTTHQHTAPEKRQHTITYYSEPCTEKPHSLPPIRACLVLSVSYFFAYTAFNGIQNLQSSVNSEANLGILSITMSYGSVIVLAPFGPYILRRFGGKTVVTFCWLTLTAYTTSNFFPSLPVFVLAGLLKGFGCSSIGLAQGMYLASASESYLLSKNLKPDRLHGVLSTFNGVFFAFLEGTQVTGNLISSIVLSANSSSAHPQLGVDYSNETACGAWHYFPLNATPETLHASEGSKNTVFIIYLISNILAVLIVLAFLPPLNPNPASGRNRGVDEKQVHYYTTGAKGNDLDTTNHAKNGPFSHKSSLREVKQSSTKSMAREETVESDVSKFTGCLRTIIDVRCLLLLPMYIGQSMTIMVIYTGFTKAFVSCTVGVHWVGYVMMVYGLTTVAVVGVVNTLARYTGRFPLVLTYLSIDTGVMSTLLVWTPVPDSSKVPLFLVAAIAGMSEAISGPQLNALIAAVFQDRRAPAFAAYHASRCVGFTAALTLIYLSPNLVPAVSLTLTCCLLGMAGYLTLEVRLWRETRASRG